jgi:GNAT superfamily N-acetyltransferase
MTDELLLRAIANEASAYRTWVERLGKPTMVDPDLSCADLQLPVALPPNSATILRPGATPVLERARVFFDERPGGPFELWSLWPVPELDAMGAFGEPVPCMVRDPGGSVPPGPPELEIIEADDEPTVRDAEALIDQVFEARGEAGELLTPACLDESFRVWVGRVDGRPVSTATAFVSDGFVGVYAVATSPEARGRGYGEAVTWAATLCRPDLPATLQASAMGRPIYERMGFRTIGNFMVWDVERRR